MTDTPAKSAARVVRFREATRDDIPAVLALMSDDILGKDREGSDPAPYLAAFEAMRAEGNNTLYVAEDAAGAVVACYQLALLSGISIGAAKRAQIEGVRVAAHLRGQGVGAALMEDAEARARAGGARLMRLTTNVARTDAHRFYDRQGYARSHLGFKKTL